MYNLSLRMGETFPKRLMRRKITRQLDYLKNCIRFCERNIHMSIGPIYKIRFRGPMTKVLNTVCDQHRTYITD